MPRWCAPLPGQAGTLGPSRLPAAPFTYSQPSPPSPPRTTFNPYRCWSAALCGPICNKQGAPKQCEVSFCRSHPSPGHSAHHRTLPFVALRSTGEHSHGHPSHAGCALGCAVITPSFCCTSFLEASGRKGHRADQGCSARRREGLGTSSFVWRAGSFLLGRPAQGSSLECFPSGPLECVSFLPHRRLGESLWRDCHRAHQLPGPSDGRPETADRLGGPRPRADIVPLAAYFFGLWLFDNSSKNSL